MGLLTKVASGVTYSDVSNQAVRNILTEISKSVYGGITEQEMEDTMKYFDWKCPYTGRDLKESVEAKNGSYATDHLYSQNRDWCGLNIKGNLVIVDAGANNAKKKMDVKTFMETDSAFWTNLGVDKATRMARLKKIQDFQRACGYDPEKIRNTVSPLLAAYYDHIRTEQEKTIATCLAKLDSVGICELTKEIPSAPTMTSAAASTKHGTYPELVFVPADETIFKTELLKSKKAHFKLTYASGKQVISHWDASRFSSSSDLRGNIQSKTFWRSRAKEGLIKVEAFLD